MKLQFTPQEYATLHAAVFRLDYSGYKPDVIEIPNGDGKADSEKRYAHVALKYLKTPEQEAALRPYLEIAHALAMQVAYRIPSLPMCLYPDIRYGALRVLEYPPGSVSNRHEDFDLFTLMMYRDHPECFLAHGDEEQALATARTLNPQAHLGQLGELIGLGKATPHEVVGSSSTQHSIVYFALPDHAQVLTGGITVRDWLNERMARSRTAFDNYK